MNVNCYKVGDWIHFSVITVAEDTIYIHHFGLGIVFRKHIQNTIVKYSDFNSYIVILCRY